jgi:XTP/dITP diphosphohydrolase
VKAATRKIVMATGNAGKLREIAELLVGSGISVIAQSSLGVIPAEETGDTFVANALQKARNAAQQTGLPALADDSGLVVDALHGMPGVRSARYAGPRATDQENIDKLLEALRGVTTRAAHFRCAAVFVRNAGDEQPLVAQGRWNGEIAERRQGSGGFGYDPVFFDPELKRCGAELTPSEKNVRSHRGQAIRALAGLLQAQWSSPGGDT